MTTFAPPRSSSSRTAPWPRVRATAADRFSGLPAWVVLVELFIGLGWLRAATEKLIDPSWWRGDGITSFLAEHDGLTLGWYEPFIDVVVSPYAALIAVVVVVAQLAAGLSLVTGRFVGAGLAVGMFLNLHFVAAGAVNPSAFYLVSQGALVLWLAERAHRRSATGLLAAVAVGAATLGMVSVPYITTLHPADVIDDPAVIFALGGVLTLVACDVAHRHLTDGDGLP